MNKYVIWSFIVQFSFFTCLKISASFKAQGRGQALRWAEAGACCELEQGHGVQMIEEGALMKAAE